MTLFVLFIAIILMVYIFYRISRIPTRKNTDATLAAAAPTNITINTGGSAPAGGPLYFDNGVEPRNVLAGISLRQPVGPAALIPVNVETQPSTSYTQVGILSRGGDVLPIMGRRLTRNKWQYYAVSNTNMFLKLPLKSNGRDCTSEYGCDEISSGDDVYVEGYGAGYKATIYQNSLLSYLPYYG
jgi:hypothetical protein